jgi:maltose/moltooligosaccharide transporter
MNTVKRQLGFWDIWNMSFGFLGIQMGFALQNGNASRILQNFGADVHELSWFWLVAPLTGMIVQPIIGFYSDRTWNRLGRRKPYFLAGTIICCIALIVLPNSGTWFTAKSALLIGAGMLMLMDASINVAMEPFRALVADNLPDKQRTYGFTIQTFLIAVGAVVGSWLPWFLNTVCGISNEVGPNEAPDNVIYSFYIGAAVFIITILVTIIKTKEYPPAEYEAIHGKPEESHHGLSDILKDFAKMPTTMRQLGLVQFFTWFGLFCMWVYTTPAMVSHVFQIPVDANGHPVDATAAAAASEVGDWVGILFGIYNAVSAIYALCLSSIAKVLGRKRTHVLSLLIGGISLISIFFIHDKWTLIVPMIGIGIAWASILAMPYAILAGSIPAGKMGVYMGIFNFFITLPQIVSGVFGGPMVKHLFGGQAIYAIVIGGFFMVCAAVCMTYVKENNNIRIQRS